MIPLQGRTLDTVIVFSTMSSMEHKDLLVAPDTVPTRIRDQTDHQSPTVKLPFIEFFLDLFRQLLPCPPS